MANASIVWITKEKIEEILVTSYAVRELSNRWLNDCIEFVSWWGIMLNRFIEKSQDIISEIISDKESAVNVILSDDTVSEDWNDWDEISMLLKNNYDFVWNPIEWFRRVSKNWKFWFVDYLGQDMIECKHDDCDDFCNSHAMIYMEWKWYWFINILLEEISTCKYIEALPFIDWIAPVLFGREWWYLNESWIEKKEVLFDDVIQEWNSYIFIRQKERYKYNSILKKMELLNIN